MGNTTPDKRRRGSVALAGSGRVSRILFGDVKAADLDTFTRIVDAVIERVRKSLSGATPSR
jgi:hypothetical protein